ncbi:hypothetical protein LDENG_00020960 [Lucifuga dentata]|nr:hypothetical protein LDENG_00020960 [Lucifuga dentata]
MTPSHSEGSLIGVCRTLFVYFWHLADKGTSSYGVFTEWSRHVFWSYIILNKPFCEPSVEELDHHSAGDAILL